MSIFIAGYISDSHITLNGRLITCFPYRSLGLCCHFLAFSSLDVFGALLITHSSPAGRGCPARRRAADSGGEAGWRRFAHIAAGPVCDDIRAGSGWAVGRAQEALFTKHISDFHALRVVHEALCPPHYVLARS